MGLFSTSNKEQTNQTAPAANTSAAGGHSMPAVPVLQNTSDVEFEEIDIENHLTKEKELADKESKSKIITKEELKEIKGEKGENQQIELGGNLTLGAKLKGFFGKPSTYSEILSKAALFNASKDVAEKQTILKELKPLARNWIDTHANQVYDENELKKQATVLKFLNQTTSTFPEIIKEYIGVQSLMDNF
jgi:hypothetical protein